MVWTRWKIICLDGWTDGTFWENQIRTEVGLMTERIVYVFWQNRIRTYVRFMIVQMVNFGRIEWELMFVDVKCTMVSKFG